MARFAFFIYRFNGRIMGSLFRKPRNVFQVEEGMISMLAGDSFDSPKVARRLRMFKFICAMTGCAASCDGVRSVCIGWRQARLQFSGGITPVDPQ
jgi:hypothetical protein